MAQPNSGGHKVEVLELGVGDEKFKFEIGEIGNFANGAVMASFGNTVLYTTACSDPRSSGDGSFVPLTVSYHERLSAAGKTSGGFVKRDSRPKDWDILVSRLVDRPIRPMFPKGWSHETQLLQWVLSYDDGHEPEPLAITAASLALLVSDIPVAEAVAAVRVGLVRGKGLVINPSAAQMAASTLDVVVAGTRSSVLMIEGYCKFLSNEQVMEAVELAVSTIKVMCAEMEEFAARAGKAPQPLAPPPPNPAMEAVAAAALAPLRQLYSSVPGKAARKVAVSALLRSVEVQLTSDTPGASTLDGKDVKSAFDALEKKVVRELALNGVRADGRGPEDIRPITSRAGLLPATHGSVLFTRGETQSICVATLGSEEDALRSDGIRGKESDKFYLQYHFPPSCVGEVDRMGAPGRRELGHGELAQRALLPAMPSPGPKWPYIVRVESTITMSNGSSSMASVCGGCLAMMDAGVPLQRRIAGIAMGLVVQQKDAAGSGSDGSSNGSSEGADYVVLSDITGSEDALGDMDFKIAGDEDGITAFQMDVKVGGITAGIMAAVLTQAQRGRQHILKEMERCDPPPRAQLAPHAPRIVSLQVSPSKLRDVIGQGGRVKRSILDSTGAENIVVDDSGRLEVWGANAACVEAAVAAITLIVDTPKPGTIFRQRVVTSVVAFGAFVEIGPGRQGLVHSSELGLEPVPDIMRVLKVGERLDVMVLEANPDGKLRLSRRAVLLKDQELAAPANGTNTDTPNAAGAASTAAGDGAPRTAAVAPSSAGSAAPTTAPPRATRGAGRGRSDREGRTFRTISER